MEKVKNITWLCLLLLFACKKNDGDPVIIETEITLHGTVKHHDWTVHNCRVYIKGDTTEFPGTITALYDSFTVTGITGEFTFTALPPGPYYLFGKGYDPVWGDTVNGSIFLMLDAPDGSHIVMDTILNVSE